MPARSRLSPSESLIRHLRYPTLRLQTFVFVGLVVCASTAVAQEGTRGNDEDIRYTPIVRAVRGVAKSVVNIQGQKTLASETAAGATRQVNGMGTGVVIDSRGYILTNFHVVDGVRPINVTLADGQKYVAQIIASDRETDLAVIRIPVNQPMPVVRFGTSHDLMAGETVVAVGNAFGYENSVTTGIISQLHRNVQVNETQQYLDLIQTDASINPGNSGGPLLNIHGDMIGVNVAVRAGAQGIGFAIPIDKALDVAARMMSIERIDRNWHGMNAVASGPRRGVTIAKLESDSPARKCGLRIGDEIEQIGPRAIERAVDVELALLGRAEGETVPVKVRRDGHAMELKLAVVPLSKKSGEEVTSPRGSQVVWDSLGLELVPEPPTTFQARKLSYQGGMLVTRVRAGSTAAQQGVVAGDILVKVHRWSTTSEKDLRFIANWASTNTNAKIAQVRFYIVRGNDEFYGNLALQNDQSVRR